MNYPDSTAGKTGYAVFPNYNVTSKETSLLADVLADKTVRRQIVRDGKLYVLALDAENEPYIYLADLAGGTVTELDKAAVVMGANGRLKISDIALTADHVLVASGLSRTQIADSYVVSDDVPETANEVRGTTNFYKWTKNEKTGLPETCELWFGSQYCCNWYRGFLGQTIAFDGTIENGTLTVSCPSGWTDTSTTMRIAQFEVSDGDMLGAMRLKASTMGTNVLGEGFQLMISPRGEKQYVFDGGSMNPTEWLTTSDNNEVTVLGTNTALNVKSVGANYFKYAGKDLMVAPAINEEGKVEGIKLFDITNGLDNATEIVLNGGTIEPVECKYASAHGELELELSTEDRTIGAEMVLYLVIDGKAVKFTEKGATTVTPKSGNANPFAYALKSEVADEALKVSYSLNTAAQSVTIKVKNASDEEVATATGAVEAGAHTAEISLANLADGDYTWEIEVAGESNTTVKEFAALRYYHPRGVDVDNNMESENFGTIYVTEGMTTTSSTYFPTNNGGVGLYIFNPDMTSVKNEVTGKYAFMGDLTYTFISYGADLARVRVSEDGRIFVTRCNNAGDYILYAPSQADLVKNDKWTSLLSGGSVDSDTYLYNVGSDYLASPNIGFDIKGSGEDLKMMTVAADKGVFSFNASGSRVDEYELGEATVLPAPTKIEALSGYTIAPQVTNVEYDEQGGVWYCQYRGTPSDAEPALIYIDANGEQKLFEGAGGSARGGGGIRISPDSKKIAIASSKTQFTIYNLYYSEDGTPIIQPETIVTHGIGTNVYDFGWDLAGNLYIVGNSGEYLKGFALPRTDAFTTKAASKYAFKIGESSAINEIEADENAPVEYYNLQGVKVTNPENGVFIKKRGNKATKVVL